MRSIYLPLFATSAALLMPAVGNAQTFSDDPTSFDFGGIYTVDTTGGGSIPSGWGSGSTNEDLTVLTANTNLYNNPDGDSRYAFYRQAYSVVIGFNDQLTGRGTPGNFNFVRDVVGNKTTTLPTSGTDTFAGKTVWHDLDREGDVSYTIDYDAAGGPTGSGTVSNLQSGSGTMWAFTASGTLGPSSITYNTSLGGTYGVANGTATMTTNNPLVNLTWGIAGLNPTYNLALYGPNGEEIAGGIDMGTSTIGSLGFAAR